MQKNRFYHWIKLQRKYRNTQKRLATTNDNTHLVEKLDRLGRRLHRINKKWRIGISTATLTAWLAMMPTGSIQAQTQANISGLPGIQLYGEGASDSFGRSVSAVGDINGDGIDDVAIGAPYADSNGNYEGTVYVLFGSNTGFEQNQELSNLDGTNGFKIFGEAGNDDSGYSVSAAGDVNGDGIDDILIGAPSSAPNGNGSGTSYVVFGKNVSEVGAFGAEVQLSGLDGTNGFKILGEAAYDNAGRSVSSAGDVNGDGIHDVLIGAPYADPNGNGNAGTTYVVFGKNVSADGAFATEIELSGLDGTNGFKIFGEATFDRSGGSVSAAGDVNGDGIEDLLIGAKYAYSNGNYGGATYVVFGKNVSEAGAFTTEVELSALDGTNGFRISGETASDGSGRSVSNAGDVNGDGIDDVLIGAPNANPGDYGFVGASYVVFGKNVSEAGAFGAEVQLSALDGTNGFRVIGEEANDYTGRSVSAAGDVNGDGIDDVLIGAPYADLLGGNTGGAYVVFGNNTGFEQNVLLSNLDGTNGFGISGEGADDSFGLSVSAAGDVNGDGSDDLVIGAPYNNQNGTTYLVFGGNFNIPVLSDSLVDARAIEEVAFTYTIPPNAFIDLLGDELTLSATLINGSSLPGWLGFDATTGTLSGTPGSEDLGLLNIRIIATDEDNFKINDEFELTVFNKFFKPFPTLSSLTLEEGFKILGEADFDNSGNSVSMIGDVNGDGIDDLFIGANDSDPNGSSSGTSYVIFGKNVSADGAFEAETQLSSLDGTNGFKIFGEAPFDRSGGSVSAAGDVNGDGINDLLIGAPNSDPNGSSSGTTYVVFGKNVSEDGPFAAEVELSALDGTNGFKIFGEAVSDQSGRSVSAAGDVNGDGIGDLLIGAPTADPNGNSSGATYVVFGKNVSEDGPFAAEVELSALDGTNGFKIFGEDAFDSSGQSVSAAGDVNGDGIHDVLIGARYADPNGNDNAGTTYVVFGKNVSADGAFAAEIELSGLDGTSGFKISGEAGGDNAGRSVSAAGDVNGDGIDDVMIGAPYSDPNGSNSGTSYVVFGKDVSTNGAFTAEIELSGLDGTNGFKIFGEAFNDNSGYSASTAGDVNGDGIDDLLIGARLADLSNRIIDVGATYLVFGRDQNNGILFPETLELSNLEVGFGFKFLGESNADQLGRSISVAGDVNGDGIDDVLIAAPYSDLNGSNSGTTYVVFGKEALAPVLPGATLADAEAVIDNLFNYEISSDTFFDPEGGSLTFSASLSDDSALPAWLTFDPVTRTFSGTPAIADLGAITVKVTAADALGLTISDEFELTVRSNTIPVLDAVGAQTTKAGNQLSFTAVATDADGDALTFSLDQISLAKGMAINPSTGLFSWTPDADDVGDNEVTLSVNDLAASDSETFTITVEANEAPVLGAIGAKTVTEGELLSFTATATDSEGDALTFSLDQASEAKGMIINASTGAFTWTPAASDVGANEVTLSVSDGVTSDSETFTITVEANESPVLGAIGAKTVTEGELLSFTATASDSEGDALTFSLDQASLAKGMTINASTGAFTWTPTASNVGNNSVTLSVNDGLTSDSETFMITVEVPLGLEDLGETIAVYPNPTKGQITFEGLSGRHRAVVYSQSGATLQDREITDGLLDISSLEAGNYLIIVKEEGKALFYSRVVKTN